MRAFHLDLNTAQFRPAYLRKMFRRWKQSGYDTILWEIEGYVRFSSCPEAASCDALSVEEFCLLLKDASGLGFQNIPLLQTLGHCEYVLRTGLYDRFRENPNEDAPYCPNAPGFREFMETWIAEYCQLFRDAEYFHIGCDETWKLGKNCPRCRKLTVPELIAAHVQSMSDILHRHRKKVMMWADMALIHPDMAQALPEDSLLIDWRYEIYPGCGGVWCWDEQGGKLTKSEDIPEETMAKFQKWLYPGKQKNEELFYTSHFLKEKGFCVALAASASCFEDNLFRGRSKIHLANTAATFAESPDSFVETSWTCHFFGYELQPAIDFPKYGSLEKFRTHWSKDRYGIESAEFWTAEEKLSPLSFFTTIRGSGHGKASRDVPADHLLLKLAELKEKFELEAMILQTEKSLASYVEGKQLFEKLAAKVMHHANEIRLRLLAARALINRAETVLYLAKGVGNREKLTNELCAIRDEYRKILRKTMLPGRAKEILHVLFAPAEYALVNHKEK